MYLWLESRPREDEEEKKVYELVSMMNDTTCRRWKVHTSFGWGGKRAVWLLKKEKRKGTMSCRDFPVSTTSKMNCPHAAGMWNPGRCCYLYTTAGSRWFFAASPHTSLNKYVFFSGVIFFIFLRLRLSPFATKIDIYFFLYTTTTTTTGSMGRVLTQPFGLRCPAGEI